MSRKLAQAMRCQLIIGSFDGNTKACPCKGRNECTLTKSDRNSLENHPLARQAKEAARIEYEQQGAVH